MLILGIEAAAKVAGAALYRNGRIIAEQMTGAGLTHSETLLPMIDAVFKASGCRPKELDYIALTHGPGSFTGLRIGAATAKGLALGLNKPLIPLSTLEVLAYLGNEESRLRVPIMDARRGQVYGAIYEGRKVLLEPSALSTTELLTILQKEQKPCIFMGDAADLYHDFFAEGLGELYSLAPAHLKDLRAGAVASLAADKLVAGSISGISGDELTIEYLRKPQAERELEAKELEAKASNSWKKSAEADSSEVSIGDKA